MTTESAVSKSSDSRPWTIREVLEWTASFFREQKCDSPRLDAEILLAHVLKCPRIQLYVRYDVVLTDDQRSRMRELVRRRAAREPVAYLVGKREFFGLDFCVSPGVFIPRPETELLVVELVETLKEQPAAAVLELCVGSGCVSVAALVNLPQIQVTAVELFPEVLKVARHNAKTHGILNRIEFCEGDLYAALPKPVLFDAIVCNPPYIETREIDELQPEVRLHEPHAALDGGLDGLDVVRRVLAGAGSHLHPGGRLLVELSPETVFVAAKIAEHNDELENVTVLRDDSGANRFLSVFRKQ
jgi:release factor glutamine methyltransferase